MANPFEQAYPSLARWVKTHGWIEVGNDGFSRSFVRALDEGGLIWEGDSSEGSGDDALRAMEAAMAEWMREEGI